MSRETRKPLNQKNARKQGFKPNIVEAGKIEPFKGSDIKLELI